MGDMLKLISYFLCHVDEDVNRDMFRKITKEDIWVVISSFKCDKSPGLEVWAIKFLDDFFGVVGDDLQRVVEESRFTGKTLGSLNSTCIAIIPKND
jgi:hypothetical protein